MVTRPIPHPACVTRRRHPPPTRYHPLALRWFLVCSQYRAPVNYSDKALEEASDRVYYLYQTLADIQAALEAAGGCSVGWLRDLDGGNGQEEAGGKTRMCGVFLGGRGE